MTENASERPRFAIVVRGYDRTQVEAYLAEYERWASQAQSQIEASDARAATAGRRVNGLESRLAELEERVGDAPPPSVKWLGDRADQIIQEAWGASQELRGRVNSEIDEAQRDRQEAARALEEARRHADELLEEARRHADQLREEALAQRVDQERAAAQLILEGQSEGTLEVALGQGQLVVGHAVLEQPVELVADQLQHFWRAAGRRRGSPR